MENHVKHLLPIHPRLAAALTLIALLLAACTLDIGIERTPTAPPPTATGTTPTIPTASRTPTATESATPTDAPTLTPTHTARPGTRIAPTHTATVTAAPPPTATPGIVSTSTPPPTATITPTPTPTPATYDLIDSFEADPTTIDPGDPVTLTWEARGDVATLYTITPDGTLGEWWEVPLVGSKTVTTSENARNLARYALFVTEDDRTESMTVAITVRCTAAWFFTPEPDLCPQDPAVRTAAAFQPFEGGDMIWLGQFDWITVLFDDQGIPAYATFANLWEEGMPESDPDITPPEGRYQPVRGFGIVWRGEIDAAAYYRVRERLGWATAPEEGYTALYQCDSAAKYTTCYVTGPGGVIYELGPENSAWNIVDGEVR
jgi:hypothetical protein